VDAAHALFQPRRVPRHVIVEEDSAELKVDAFSGGVGPDEEPWWMRW